MNLLHCLPMDIQNQNVSKPTGQLCYQSSLRNTSLFGARSFFRPFLVNEEDPFRMTAVSLPSSEGAA